MKEGMFELCCVMAKKLRKLALDVLARLYQAGNNQGDIEIINAGQHNSIKIQLFVYKPWTFNSK